MAARSLADRLHLFLARARSPATDTLVVRAVYLRLLGLVLAIAFVSFWVQASGLIGDDGILPVVDYLPRVRQRLHGEAFWRLPSLIWLWPNEGGVHALCALGTAASLVVMLGWAPAAGLFVAFVSYLSLFYAGQIWLSFQWDLLLLETTFLGIFLAPWRVRPSSVADDPAPRFVVWLHLWLLARLMLSSGVGKLLGGDPSWRDLSALDYHFWTQPLPNPLAWYAHHAGPGVHAALVVFTYVAQIGAPLLLFVGKWPRRAGAGLILLSQLGIQATGNFAYFNLLSMALAWLALDDELVGELYRRSRTGLRRLLRRREEAPAPAAPSAPAPSTTPPPAVRGRAATTRAAAVLLGFLTVVQALATFRVDATPDVVVEAADLFRPLRLVSGYGLFIHMTKERREIELEGSDDGQTWTAWVFRKKPGPVDRGLPFVAPHQPRLDWQMWFAALGSIERNRWVEATLKKLLEGEPSVLGLLAEDPFPDGPPRYARAFVYRYRFSTPEERAATGAVWIREPVGLYARPAARR